MTDDDLSATPAGAPLVQRNSLTSAAERVASTSTLTMLLRRPEAGVVVGLLATFAIFGLLPGAAALYSLQGAMTFLTLAA